jgi:hypothetical protein
MRSTPGMCPLLSVPTAAVWSFKCYRRRNRHSGLLFIEQRTNGFLRDGNAMNTNNPRYWFRAKRYGMGWGLPLAWQGWVFFFMDVNCSFRCAVSDAGRQADAVGFHSRNGHCLSFVSGKANRPDDDGIAGTTTDGPEADYHDRPLPGLRAPQCLRFSRRRSVVDVMTE